MLVFPSFPASNPHDPSTCATVASCSDPSDTLQPESSPSRTSRVLTAESMGAGTPAGGGCTSEEVPDERVPNTSAMVTRRPQQGVHRWSGVSEALGSSSNCERRRGADLVRGTTGQPGLRHGQGEDRQVPKCSEKCPRGRVFQCLLREVVDQCGWIRSSSPGFGSTGRSPTAVGLQSGHEEKGRGMRQFLACGNLSGRISAAERKPRDSAEPGGR